MHQHYELRPSPTYQFLLISGHVLAGSLIYSYVEPNLLKLAGMALVFLLAIRESRCLIQQGIIKLRVDPVTASIELEQGGQPYFYRKYKVHPTRWFAILKLIDEVKPRTLILIPDRFNSKQSYRQLRYLLRRMESRRAA